MHMIYRDRDHSEGRGVGVNGRLEPFRKIIRFGSVTRPLLKSQKKGPITDCSPIDVINNLKKKRNVICHKCRPLCPVWSINIAKDTTDVGAF